MKGLLYKEWATLTSSYKQTVFFIAFLYGGISILTGQTGMAYALLVVFSILITSTISFDENSHWDIYARTLPVTPAQLVGSKYLFGLCGLALGTVCTVLIVALNNVLPPLLFWHTSYKVPPLECLAALLACGSTGAAVWGAHMAGSVGAAFGRVFAAAVLSVQQCQGPQLVVSDHRCARRLYWAGRFRLARFDAAVQCLRRSAADGAGCSVCGAAGGVFCEL